MNRLAAVLLALTASAVPAGCGYLGTAREFEPAALEREPGWLAARDVPFVGQQAAEDCGAAALTMAMAAWDGRTTLDEVKTVCPPEPGRGNRAGDLRDLARARGFRAFLFHGELADLERELRGGRPVLVGLVKPHIAGPLAHYEVVVALHPARQIVVTLDPGGGWRQNGFEGFFREWDATGRLTLVLFRPRESSVAGRTVRKDGVRI